MMTPPCKASVPEHRPVAARRAATAEATGHWSGRSRQGYIVVLTTVLYHQVAARDGTGIDELVFHARGNLHTVARRHASSRAPSKPELELAPQTDTEFRHRGMAVHIAFGVWRHFELRDAHTVRLHQGLPALNRNHRHPDRSSTYPLPAQQVKSLDC